MRVGVYAVVRSAVVHSVQHTSANESPVVTMGKINGSAVNRRGKKKREGKTFEDKCGKKKSRTVKVKTHL